MKTFVLILFSFLFITQSISQTITAAGIVKNEKGDPVRAALVSEFKTKSPSATYTDSLGFFSFQVSTYSKLKISCKGFNDTLVNVGNDRVTVVLSPAGPDKTILNVDNNSDNHLINKNIMQDAVSTQTGISNNYVYGGGVRNYTGSLMPVFTYKEETKGSRYLLDGWMQGYAKDIKGNEIQNSRYLFNYDKMEGSLLMTQDKQSAIEVDKNQIQSFTVFNIATVPMVFENVPVIDTSRFVQLIASSSKYKVYKLIKTKFVKSNYQTNGISSTGNLYDEYVDEYSYYCKNLKSDSIQKFSLKKKAIKEVFVSDLARINDFYSLHAQDNVNDIFLQRLVNFLEN